MKLKLTILLAIASFLPLQLIASESYESSIRPPAAPLVTVDPYFSIWSMTDNPASDTTRHWTTRAHPLTGTVEVDGRLWRFLGAPSVIPGITSESTAAEMQSVNVLPTKTEYRFRCGSIDLLVSFLAPCLPDDFDLLSRPVNYLCWEAVSNDGKTHDCVIRIAASPRIAINSEVVPMCLEKGSGEGINFVRTGTVDQPILATRGDDVRIDWGYFYLAAPKGKGTVGISGGAKQVESADFEKEGLFLEFKENMGKVGKEAKGGYVMLAYDDIWSIEYLGERLRPYWNRNSDNSIIHELSLAASDKKEIERRCEDFDRRLLYDAIEAGGHEYADLCALAYRQVISAHKLVSTKDGKIYFISKENNSNGCAGTVDVTYPSIPMLLLYNNALAKATIDFVFDYCDTPAWKDKRKATWATHDIGVYPQAYGQHYGSWMALEECGNLLLLTAAVCAMDGNASYAEKHWEDLTLWTLFLIDGGMNPENQLCTDDFAGKLAHNVNLSAKSIEGIAAYASLASALGKNAEAAAFRRKAEEMAGKWKEMGLEDDHYRLAFDAEGTWSMKYNLAWDRILGLNLFEDELIEKELKYYLSKSNRYGVPLDSRKNYTKTDWILWTASMAGDKETFRKFVLPVYDFYNETVDRLPMGDWVDTDAPTHRAMYCRSVVGGFFMRILGKRVSERTE